MCIGVPAQIVRFVDDTKQTAVVDLNGTQQTINTGMVATDADPADAGDWVLVHMGIALHRVDPAEASDTQDFFDDLLADFERIAAERHDS